MKKKIAIILVCVLSLTLIFAMAGCGTDLSKEDGIKALETAIMNTEAATTFNVRTIVVKDAHNSTEYQYDVFGTDSARFTTVTNEGTNTTYDHKYFGKSLKSGVKAKKATDADWKVCIFQDSKKFKNEKKEEIVKWKVTEAKFEDFANIDIVKQNDLDVVADKAEKVLEEMKAGNLTADYCKTIGRVTTIKFNNIGKELGDELGISAAKDGKNYPLLIEITNEKISKFIDNSENPKTKHLISYQGPKVVLPNWDNAY